MRPSVAVVLAVLVLSAGACATALVPDASRLAPWTTALRDAQPPDATAAVYRTGDRVLVFVGALHTTDTSSRTFALVEGAFDTFRIDAVLVEGVEYAQGPDPARLLAYVAEQRERDGVQPGGETVPAVEGALREGATVWGGEPSDRDVLARAVALGVTEADVLGFYVLRVVPQWVSEGVTDGPADSRTAGLVASELAASRARLGLGPGVLPDAGSWAGWYARTNGRPFADGIEDDEIGPLVDGRHGTNRIAAAVSRTRDGFLLERIAERLGAGESVLVVYGASHLPIQRPALDALLGPPCYVGADLATSPAACAGR